MSSPREHLRTEYPRQSTTALVWLVSMFLAAYVLQLICLSAPLAPTGATVVRFLSLSIAGLQNWHGWTLLTHALLHDTGSPFDILVTIGGLIFAGRELEPLLGPRRLIAVFASAILLGGLAWTSVHLTLGGTLSGAGAGVYALLVILTCLQPRQQLALFPFPVSFQLKYLVYGLMAIDLFGLLFCEIRGVQFPLALNPSAHLGGMLGGWLYGRYLHAPAGWDRAADLAPPGWLEAGPGKRPAPSPARIAPRPPAALRVEVDLILDKINSHGFASLSAEEKRTLDEAKDLLSKH